MKRSYFYLTLLILAVALIVNYFDQNDLGSLTDNNTAPLDETNLLSLQHKMADYLAQIWRKPTRFVEKVDIDKNCTSTLGQTYLAGEDFYSCHPDVMNCLLQQAELKSTLTMSFLHENFRVSIRPLKVYAHPYKKKKVFYRVVSKTLRTLPAIAHTHVAYAFPLEISYGNQKLQLNLALPPDCHQVYLPEGVYAYGAINTRQKNYGESLIWSNKGRRLYLDSYPVSVRQINEWAALNNFKNLISDSSEYFPSLSLNLTQMKKFCEFYGKKLMEAHIYDAATFLWDDHDKAKLTDLLLPRSPHHWDQREAKILTCDRVLSKECVNDFKLLYYHRYSPTWAGLYNVLGGYMEAMNNPYHSDFNLKASSFYFKRDSFWHQLGRRAMWTGEGHDQQHFEWRDVKSLTQVREAPGVEEQKLEVGFRCYLEK